MILPWDKIQLQLCYVAYPYRCLYHVIIPVKTLLRGISSQAFYHVIHPSYNSATWYILTGVFTMWYIPVTTLQRDISSQVFLPCDTSQLQLYYVVYLHRRFTMWHIPVTTLQRDISSQVFLPCDTSQLQLCNVIYPHRWFYHVIHPSYNSTTWYTLTGVFTTWYIPVTTLLHGISSQGVLPCDTSQLQFCYGIYPRMNKRTMSRTNRCTLSGHKREQNPFLKSHTRHVSLVLLLTLLQLAWVMISCFDTIRTRSILTRSYYNSHFKTNLCNYF